MSIPEINLTKAIINKTLRTLLQRQVSLIKNTKECINKNMDITEVETVVVMVMVDQHLLRATCPKLSL